jgi:hypothetical protein
MANVYNTTQTNITAAATYTAVFTATASTSLIRAIRIVHDSGSSTATLALTKSGGTRADMGEFAISAKTMTNTITEILPLSAGDVIEVKCNHQPTRVYVSYAENVVSVAGQSIDVHTDVDTTGKANGNVLTWDATAGQWEAAAPVALGVTSVTGTAPIVSSGGTTPAISINAATTSTDGSMSAGDKLKLDGIATAAEVNQNAWSNIAVSGQTTIAANAKTDTLNVAAANTNVALTTNAATDTLTIGIANDLVLATVSTTGNIAAIGNLSGANISSSGNINATGTLTAGTAVLGTLSFTGGGTSTIGPDNSLPNDPDDLAIRSNGNIDVILDYDDNETSQAFRVKDGDGNVMFSVDEDGISVANGTASTGAVIRLGEATANGTNYVALQSATALAANVTFTLPSADGTAGQVLSTNASGALSFVTKRLVQVTGKTVATGAWSLVSGFYEASISDAGISATSVVNVIPDNASASVAATAGVLPRTDSSAGAVKIYATAIPASTLTLTINIIDL